ncbi:type II toxin-antitoxin system VapC family toxin [Thermoleptolyngbya sp. C42_A2020_037]|uniref:type II toxin-antitoxin system VapC family toxin n=1 Tax=Thermoleptolyngbya sp. C42_A2020_037 TaxID=2747799 RepID=UPI0019FC0359|nr:PIN domain-containing protein [Thermoleptolyngbya sp. C42_A2020_037]MBF2085559.1 type II toxin-antitoxin system VapC family toxin [Thermoleptolyngbya sp. C42_A2020_037]
MTVFIDTAYWVARIDKRDQWRDRAKAVTQRLLTTPLVTTELVLVEVLNYFSGYRAEVKQEVAGIVASLLDESDIRVIWQSRDLMRKGLALYRDRLDKGYSLTDCVSMVVMRQETIQKVLTHDRHFLQEGFSILL